MKLPTPIPLLYKGKLVVFSSRYEAYRYITLNELQGMRVIRINRVQEFFGDIKMKTTLFACFILLFISVSAFSQVWTTGYELQVSWGDNGAWADIPSQSLVYSTTPILPDVPITFPGKNRVQFIGYEWVIVNDVGSYQERTVTAVIDLVVPENKWYMDCRVRVRGKLTLDNVDYLGDWSLPSDPVHVVNVNLLVKTVPLFTGKE